MKFAIFYIVVTCLITISSGHLDLPNACTVHPYNKKSMAECDVAGEFWSLMVYNSREVYACCKNERDATIVAAPNERTRGLYYGDSYKICETIHVDQETCRSRESRDCNYRTATYKNQYIGCFYCRARCENNYQCADLGRICSICRPEQPVTACTEQVFATNEPLQYYNGAGRGFNETRQGDDSLMTSTTVTTNPSQVKLISASTSVQGETHA